MDSTYQDIESTFQDESAPVKEYDEKYLQAWLSWSGFYPLANEDLRMFLGDQWNETERLKLFSEGRKSWCFNLIRKNINLVDGYQRSHRFSSVVVPQQAKDQQAADDLSDLLQYVMQNADGYKAISDAFSGAIKTGWNLCTIYMDYTNDPINGDIKFGREPYSGFITDPFFTKLDFSDCGYVMRRKYLSPEQAASLLPDMEEKVWEVYRQGWSRDDKFTWLPYQTQAEGLQYVAFNENYKQVWKKVPLLVDEQTGESMEWKGSKKSLKYMLKTYPQLKVVDKQVKSVKCDIIINDVYFKTIEDQYGLDEYPFVPFVGIFEPECEVWDLKLQSLVRCMVDPQRESNRRLSQMTDLVESQINSGWIADEESVINPRSLFQTGQGKVIWRDRSAKPGAIERIQPAQIPPSLFQLQDLYSKSMSEILGVNDAAFGVPQSGNESGVMMMLRQGAAITNLQVVFDNLRYSQKNLSKKVLKLLQTWKPEKVEKILGRKPSEMFYSKEFIEYDISVTEGPLTDTQKQTFFRQLVDVYTLSGGPGVSPITPQMLVENAPIQSKGTILAQIKQNEEMKMQTQAQQAQIQQAMQQKQVEAIDATIQNTKSSSIEKLAGAKERFSRAFANTSLETERTARAVEDRADAALTRVKAMKELESMDDDKLIKYLNIIQNLEARNEAKEEKIREEDLAISAQGQQLGDLLTGIPSQNIQLPESISMQNPGEMPV
jgi:hypothetical protein